MMKPAYLTAFLLLLRFFVYSQDTAMQRILAAKDDTAKVIQLANYAYPFTDTDTAKAQRLYAELMRLSRKLNYPYWTGMVWVNRGYMNAQAARDREAIGNYDSALVYLRKTTRVDMQALCHLNIGNISERLGNTNAKVLHLTEAMRLLENTKYKDLLNRIYNSMGVLFYNQDNFGKGLFYFQKAEQSARESKDTANLSEAMFGIVNCLSSQKKFEQARKKGTELLSLATASKNNSDLLHAHTALSELYRKWKKAVPTIEHAEKIFQYATASGNVQYQLIGLLGLADGYTLAKAYAKSIAYYNKALQLGKEKGVVIQLDDIYKGLSDAYAQLDQPHQSLEFYRKYIQYRDSANNEKVKQNAAELDVKYQTVQKEKTLSENRLQMAQNELQLQKSRQLSLYSIGATVVALLVALLIFLHFRHKRRLDRKRLQTLQQEKEIQLLHAAMEGEEKERSRIAKDLHDGVAAMLAAAKMQLGSLSIRHQVLAGEKEFVQAVKLLDDSSHEVRLTSHNLMPEILMQHGLEEALRRFCHNISNDRVLQIQYAANGRIGRYSLGFELTVYRIVQELLNNVLKHSKATEAFVQLSAKENILFIFIEDNGIGFQPSSPGDGTGLQSLQARIKAINGRFEIEATGNRGVSAYLEFNTTGLEI